MTPLELARQECANYDQDRCLGAAIDNSNCHPLPRCVLHFNQRCGYFERCVLPMANRGTPEFVEARRRYDHINGLAAVVALKCPCGKPRDPQRRLCDDCREEHRRKATRDAMRKKRT